jgi:protein-S-isoprenylcysteine O-methyltransferase Ste14
MNIVQKRLRKITLKTLPLYLFAAVLVFLVYRGGTHPRTFWIGAGVVLIGELVRLWAAGHLKKNAEVTTSGPYAYVKNPLYLGTFLILLGFCVQAWNPWLFAIGASIFLFYYAPVKKQREGDRLRERFGTVWDAYDRAVPDYVPRFTPYKERGERSWSASTCWDNSEVGTALVVFLGTALIGARLWGG